MSDCDERVAIGDAARAAGDLDAAAVAYEEALAATPDHVDALQGRAIVRQRRGDPEGAKADFVRSVEVAPRNLRALLNLARMLIALGEHEEAAVWADEATRLHPDAPRAWFVLGGAQRGIGALGAARQSLARSHALAPDAPETLVNLAAVEQALGMLDDALEHLDDALEHAPDEPAALLNQASVLLDLGEVEEAGEAIEEARQVVGAHPVLDHLEGRLRALSGDDASAEIYFLRAIEGLPGAMRSAHEDFGQMLARAGRFDEALEQLELACRLDPTAPDPWQHRAEVLAALGRPREALAVLEDALHHARPSASLHRRYLVALTQDPHTTREAWVEAETEWAARWASPPPGPAPPDPDPE